MGKKVSLFLDSGAFSAYSQNTTINIDEYIAFIKANKDYIEVYACLDVIGDPVATYKNQKYMESKGLKPLIAFHNREPYEWLERYVREYDYVALGGTAVSGVTRAAISKHMEKCWSIICKKDGYPKCKVHGFGMTSLNILFRYPWFSVDSTSWVMTSRFGCVYVPRFKNGKYLYDEGSWKVTVSNKSSGMKEEGKHLTTFSPNEQKIITNYFTMKGFKIGKSEIQKVEKDYKLNTGERWLGKEEADSQRGVKGDRSGYVDKGFSQDLYVERVIESGLCNDYRLRDQLNVIYFLDLEKSFPPWPWAFKKEGSSMKGFGLVK